MDDEQVIANQIVFDPVLVEEPKEFGVVVLADLDPTRHGRQLFRLLLLVR